MFLKKELVMNPVDRLKEILESNKDWVAKNDFFTKELPQGENGNRRAARIRFKDKVVRVEALYTKADGKTGWMSAGSYYASRMVITHSMGVRLGATLVSARGVMTHG
jgi:hypothetical protein